MAVAILVCLPLSLLVVTDGEFKAQPSSSLETFSRSDPIIRHSNRGGKRRIFTYNFDSPIHRPV